MIDKNKIISESEIPILVPSTDEAWEAMLKKLEEDEPKPVPIFGNSSKTILRIVTGIAFLLLIVWLSWYFINRNSPKDGSEDVKQISASKSDKTLSKETIQSSDSDVKNKENVEGEKVNNKSIESKNVNGNTTNEDQLAAGNPGTKIKKAKEQVKNRNNSAISSLKNKSRKGPDQKWADRGEDDYLIIPGDADFKYSSIHYSLLSAGAIKRPLFTHMKISGGTKDEPEPVQNSYWLMEAGLEWNLSIPFSSARNMLDGPNGNFQPYRILLPGAWVRLEAGRHSMSLSVNPFYTALLPNKSFEIFDSVATSADTTRSYIETRTLKKLFGISASFEYNYNIAGQLWVGAGIQSSFWGNGLVGLNGEVRKLPLNGSPMIITPYTSERAIKDEEWNYFSKSQIGLTGQFFYRKKPWDAGLRLSLPVTPLAKQDGPSNPFRAEFLFRIKLIDWRIKQ